MGLAITKKQCLTKKGGGIAITALAGEKQKPSSKTHFSSQCYPKTSEAQVCQKQAGRIELAK
jgi:hypothetical protein